MRLKQIKSVASLKSKVEELCPDCQFISQTTSVQGVKGRYNGFDLGNGLSVGVFRKANTNMCRIITRGDTTDRTYLVDGVINILSAEGFPKF